MIAPSASTLRPVAAIAILAFGLGVSLRACRGHERGLRIATFNIENLGDPEKDTDLDRLAALLGELDADVVSVEEIRRPSVLEAVVARVAARGRRYRVALSGCGGRLGMHVGFIFDEARVSLVGTREYRELRTDGEGACHEGGRPGLVGEFARGERRFGLLALHLKAGGAVEDQAERRRQWRGAIAIADRERTRGLDAIALLGDVNSTGFLDDRHGERSWLVATLERAGFSLPSATLACSEYWRPDEGGPFVPSLLDHVALRGDLGLAPVARVHGYCAQVACAPRLDELPPDYARVSDHCPISVGAVGE